MVSSCLFIFKGANTLSASASKSIHLQDESKLPLDESFDLNNLSSDSALEVTRLASLEKMLHSNLANRLAITIHYADGIGILQRQNSCGPSLWRFVSFLVKGMMSASAAAKEIGAVAGRE